MNHQPVYTTFNNSPSREICQLSPVAPLRITSPVSWAPPKTSDVVSGARAEAVVSTVTLVFLLQFETLFSVLTNIHKSFLPQSIHRCQEKLPQIISRLCQTSSFSHSDLLLCNQSVFPSDSGSLSPSSGTAACRLSGDHSPDICFKPFLTL